MVIGDVRKLKWTLLIQLLLWSACVFFQKLFFSESESVFSVSYMLIGLCFFAVAALHLYDRGGATVRLVKEKFPDELIVTSGICVNYQGSELFKFYGSRYRFDDFERNIFMWANFFPVAVVLDDRVEVYAKVLMEPRHIITIPICDIVRVRAAEYAYGGNMAGAYELELCRNGKTYYFAVSPNYKKRWAYILMSPRQVVPVAEAVAKKLGVPFDPVIPVRRRGEFVYDTSVFHEPVAVNPEVNNAHRDLAGPSDFHEGKHSPENSAAAEAAKQKWGEGGNGILPSRWISSDSSVVWSGRKLKLIGKLFVLIMVVSLFRLSSYRGFELALAQVLVCCEFFVLVWAVCVWVLGAGIYGAVRWLRVQAADAAGAAVVVRPGLYASYGGAHLLKKLGAVRVFDSQTYAWLRGRYIVSALATSNGLNVFYGVLKPVKPLLTIPAADVVSVAVSKYRVCELWYPVLEFRVLVDGAEECLAFSEFSCRKFMFRPCNDEPRVRDHAERAAATLGVPFDSEVRERDIDSYRFTSNRV